MGWTDSAVVAELAVGRSGWLGSELAKAEFADTERQGAVAGTQSRLHRG